MVKFRIEGFFHSGHCSLLSLQHLVRDAGSAARCTLELIAELLDSDWLLLIGIEFEVKHLGQTVLNVIHLNELLTLTLRHRSTRIRDFEVVGRNKFGSVDLVRSDLGKNGLICLLMGCLRVLEVEMALDLRLLLIVLNDVVRFRNQS